ncbi:MAG: HAMP domain-containing histidine kinase [Bacteroidetes bacterium]|nr:HAMP domain-containing histidine kinase [Bacteroidota bacterium]
MLRCIFDTMQKKTIPILIALMILALGGIIFIQYTWIQKSVTEKQQLVDNKVVQAISNVDIQLSEMGALIFFAGNENFNIQLHDSLMFQAGFDSAIPRHMPIMHAAGFPPDRMEVQITTTQHQANDSITVSHTEIIHHKEHVDSMRFELQQLEEELIKLDEVRTVFDRIRFETNGGSDDVRLDSTRIKHVLKAEFESVQLDTNMTWGVYDALEKDYVISPGSVVDFRYKIPLFKNDVIHPGRYILQLNLPNNTAIIWADIRLMIFMSALFTLIVLTVFIIAVRLIVKHKKISQIKSDFINNMTHEFKTPLASISLAADSIIHPNIIHDPKRITDYVQIIHEEKSKLNQNVERILEVAALEKDAVVLPAEIIDLPALIREAVHNLKLLIQSKNGTLELALTDGLSISGSAYHLNQALSNIIENGIKYSEEKPTLKITLAQKGNLAEIQISDFGIGMTPQQVKRVFDTFYRAETGNIHNTKGFGLGLTYARFIIEEMKGSIELVSELKRGTTVIIQFPLV